MPDGSDPYILRTVITFPDEVQVSTSTAKFLQEVSDRGNSQTEDICRDCAKGSGLTGGMVPRMADEELVSRLKVLPGGFGPRFLKQFKDSASIAPPPWKMFLAVLVGIYSTVMLLTVFIAPYTHSVGLAWVMLPER